MTDHLLRLHGDVLAAMRRGPRNFAKLAFAIAEDEEPADTDQGDFRDRVTAAGAGDELTALWHRTLTGWDLAEQADWSTAPPRTDERRTDAYDRLGFDSTLRKVLDHAVPVFKEPGPTTHQHHADLVVLPRHSRGPVLLLERVRAAPAPQGLVGRRRGG
ncbi:hypothetical protein GA0115255_102391, partial [Streptomyces sp. Ncost-T6T-2b]